MPASNIPDARLPPGDRLDQARLLLALHPKADFDYLERRIREETMGDYGIEDIEG